MNSFKPVILGSIVLSSISCKSEMKDKANLVVPQKPNILIFFCDDMGLGDAGCYGQEKILTPNIDKLANQGIRFTDAYTASPVSAPSRSCLMTGTHGGHTRVRNNKSIQGDEIGFVDSTFTMAELLKNVGYVTGIFGKWGLGKAGSEGVPNKQGFDEFYGYLNQSLAHHYYPDSLWHNEKLIKVPLSEEKQYSSADWYLDKAIEWIQSNKDTAFFCYIPTQLPHLNMPYKPMDIYKDKPWPEGDKRYATMVSMIDKHIGMIVHKLDSLGISENTIIMFMSDNGGGDGQRIYYHDTRFFKSNLNFRGIKRELYEGGIRVPFIVKWPQVIKQQTISNEPVVYYDLMETVAELTGQKIESDGESLLKLFTGESDTLKREYIYWEFPYMNIPNAKQAVLKGEWKAVRNYVREEIQLYNIKEDPEELFNWVKERPEMAKEMVDIMNKEHSPSVYWPLEYELKKQ